MIKAKAKFTLTFDSEKTADAICCALKPEMDAGPTDRAKVLLHLNENMLGIDITAMDSASLRACVNTYSRWINMTKSLVEV
jgi:tRNA threonylcarbamoyladenosine modification (KEOPS) complex  Pcc1 subunit